MGKKKAGIYRVFSEAVARGGGAHLATMASQPFSFVACFERMASRDKDLRVMAVSDFGNELKKDSFRLDDLLAAKAVELAFLALDDSCSEVHTLAVNNCFGPLASKVFDFFFRNDCYRMS